MRINNNLMAMNTHRQLGTANTDSAKSIEKLSSGYRINRAGDDAAGLAISEKMRGQIRGLNQASANSQDGISMIQTAEGALTETHAILQRMRELAVQSGNDTNVGVDRSEIQKEMDQLTTEINRIGNTTEFNTQSILKGDGKANLAETTKAKNGNLAGGDVTTVEAKQIATLTAAAGAGETAIFTLNGEEITISFVANSVAGDDDKISNVTGNSATINLKAAAASNTADTGAAAITAALKDIIEQNDKLKGNFTVSNATTAVTIEAAKTGVFSGKDGNIAAAKGSVGGVSAAVASIGTTTEVKATLDDAVDFSSATDSATALEFAGKGFTVGDKQIEFYNADKGAYTGNAIGVNISGAASAANIISAIVDQAGPQIEDVTFSTGTTAGHLAITAKDGGKAGNDIKVKDGGVQESFTANFQVGANQGQSMAIEIKDMRANALGLTGKAGAEGFIKNNSVTNGMNNNGVEAALDVSTHEKAAASITVINNAIEKVSAQRSSLGAFQNRLEHTIKNLDTSSENLQAAEARIRDVDMAKEMMEQTKNNILAQASTAMLAQANQAPQAVLQLLR